MACMWGDHSHYPGLAMPLSGASLLGPVLSWGGKTAQRQLTCVLSSSGTVHQETVTCPRRQLISAQLLMESIPPSGSTTPEPHEAGQSVDKWTYKSRARVPAAGFCWHSPPPAGTSSTQLWDCCCLAFRQESALGGRAGHPPIPILHSFIGYAYVICNESLFLLRGHLARDPPATFTFCHHRLCSNCPRGPGSPAVLAMPPTILSLGPVPRVSFLKGRSDRAVCLLQYFSSKICIAQQSL